jgi:hypothetical protein
MLSGGRAAQQDQGRRGALRRPEPAICMLLYHHFAASRRAVIVDCLVLIFAGRVGLGGIKF